MPATRSKRRSGEWFTRPDVLAARAKLDSQFMMLGCSMGSSRLEGLVSTMRKLLRDEVDGLEEAVATLAKGPEAEAVATLAEAICLLFSEPTQSLAVQIDELGVAKPLVPGAYGRLWCRHTVDAAWIIWSAKATSWRGASGVSEAPDPLVF